MRLIAAALCLLAGSAFAEPTAFGTRTLEIPVPAGFLPASKEAPHFMQISQGYLPPANRLVEIYVTPQDRSAFAEGRDVELARYFQLQVGRPVDGKAIVPSEFAGARDLMETELKKALGTVDELTKGLTDQGNAQLKQTTGSDAQLKIGQVRYLGTFRREPWGLFFTIGSDVSISGPDVASDEDAVLSSGSLVLVNHQILYLYAYVEEAQPEARRWAESSVSAWADAVRAANPDDPAVAKTAVSLQGTNPFKTLGAIIGALLGVIVALWLARRKS